MELDVLRRGGGLVVREDESVEKKGVKRGKVEKKRKEKKEEEKKEDGVKWVWKN